MPNLSDKTALVIDNGIYFEFARTMAKSFKKVYYFCEYRNAFPSIDRAAIGNEYVGGHALHTFDGLPIHRITDLWDVVDEVDIAIFPDVGNGDLAEYLRRRGIPVFGSGRGEVLELGRIKAKAMLSEQGLPVHPYTTAIGTTALRAALAEKGSCYIKISKYRGVFETFHHTGMDGSALWINDIEQRLGKLAEIVSFIIEEPLEAKVEIGTDSYTVDGQYPKQMIAGTEIKDLGYCGKVFSYDEQPAGTRTVDDGLSAIFKELSYRGFYSTEIRETAEGAPHMVDFTARMPLPPGFLYSLMYSNLAEIVWGAAHGELVEPVVAKKYGMMVMLNSPWHCNHMLHISFPEEYREHVQLLLPVKIDGGYYWISQYDMDEFGAVSVAGDSIEECMEKARKILATVEAHQFRWDEGVLDRAAEAFGVMEAG